MRATYPSDITRNQFSVIEHELQSPRKVTHPRTYDLYDIFCAILYVLKEGCTPAPGFSQEEYRKPLVSNIECGRQKRRSHTV
jgi:hypothetical protein